MIVSIHQPGYLPWHGLFHRIALSDVHVFFDTAQFEKNGFNNRVRIRAGHGVQWLTVPIRAKGRFGSHPLSDARIDAASRWRGAHWKTLVQAYGRAPHFRASADFLETLYHTPWTHLVSLNVECIRYFAAALGLECRFVLASTLDGAGTCSSLVLSLCRAVGATTYVSGPNGRAYLDGAAFAQAGVAVRFQTYQEPRYAHVRGGHEAFMSVVDLLTHHGPSARDLMMAGQDTLATGTADA